MSERIDVQKFLGDAVQASWEQITRQTGESPSAEPVSDATERAIERVYSFLDGFTALGSVRPPDVIHSVFVRKEDGPRELLVHDLMLVLQAAAGRRAVG